MAVKHIGRDSDPQRSLCGRNMVPGFEIRGMRDCKLCVKIHAIAAAEDAAVDQAGTWSPVPASAVATFELTESGRAKVAAFLAERAQETPADVPMTCGYCTRACNGYHFGRKMNVPLTPFVETPADRHMAGRCRDVVGEHCHCTLEYGMPDGERRSCLVCEPNAPAYVETGVCACGVRLASGVPGRIAEIAEVCSHIPASVRPGIDGLGFRAPRGKRKPSARRRGR